MKKIVTLYVEEQLIEDGKSKGLNLSRFFESKLKEFVRGNVSMLEKQHSGMHQYISAFIKHKREYEKWLISQGLSDGYIKDLVNSLTGFIREDISDIADNITDRQNISMRSYLNYLSQKSLVSDEQVARFKKKLPLKQSKADNYIQSNDEVIHAYKQLNDKRFQTIFKLLAFSGARITELVKMVKEYEPSKLIVNEKFAKYQLHYKRGYKSSFYIYMPKEMVSDLHKFYMHVDTITHQISKSGLNPKYLCTWFYNFLIYNNVPEGVADFIEGRASSSVGSMHYLAKAKQVDYWYEQIVDDLL
ncbi:MAG: integrase [Thermoplasmataceae archaeon]|jgi:intergrase/recombinase